jgi:hypothetical protein
MMMRRVLVDRARANRHETRRRARQVTLGDVEPATQRIPVSMSCLARGTRTARRVGRRSGPLVELRYFGGLNIDDTAKTLGVSPTTAVKRGGPSRALAPPRARAPRDAERWGRVKALFADATAVAPEARLEFVKARLMVTTSCATKRCRFFARGCRQVSPPRASDRRGDRRRAACLAGRAHRRRRSARDARIGAGPAVRDCSSIGRGSMGSCISHANGPERFGDQGAPA